MDTFILPFCSPDATLAIVGSKGANLSRMAHASFSVPPGFLITTAAYRAFVQANDLQAQIVRLATDKMKTVDETSAAIRPLFERGGIPPEVAATIQSAYAELLRASGDESYWRWCGIWNR